MKRTLWNPRLAGFTLVELLVVIVVAAILVAIAVPTYQNQVRQSRRTDAKTAVLDLAAREEKYLSLNNAYTASPANLGYVASTSTATFPQTVGSGYYQVYVCVAATVGTTVAGTPCVAASAVTAVGTSYVVAAIPVSSTQLADTPCQYFAVDNTGTQFATSSITGSGTDTTSTCWQ